MKRREFITLLGGVASAYLRPAACSRAENPDFQTWIGAFQQRLAQSGGHNMWKARRFLLKG